MDIADKVLPRCGAVAQALVLTFMQDLFMMQMSTKYSGAIFINLLKEKSTVLKLRTGNFHRTFKVLKLN